MPDKKVAKLRPRERDSILQSLHAGVTPRTGLQHIQVGRVQEIAALLKDIETIRDGGACFRLIIGEFGSGKSFFLQVIRNIALEKELVTVHADLSPDRRLFSTGGHARNLYAELMRNMSTRTKPDGGALTSVVQRFVTSARKQADESDQRVEAVISQRLTSLTELVDGYDFAKVIEAYWRGYESGNEALMSDAVRWLRGEFTTKTDARAALDVRTFVNDSNVYDHFKLLSLFVRQAGYAGLYVMLDEMVNLYKLSNQKARVSNYEQVLRMLNDCLQGSAFHMGFLLCGTPEFLLDSRKGLYSYEALQSRLAENTFARAAGVADFSGPTVHLANLAPEEMLILLENLRRVFAYGDEDKYLVPDVALSSFLAHCQNRIGDAYFRTPRNTIKVFVDLLSVLEHNPELSWTDLIEKVDVGLETNTDMPAVEEEEAADEDDDGLATFRL